MGAPQLPSLRQFLFERNQNAIPVGQLSFFEMSHTPTAEKHVIVLDDDAAVRNSLKFSLETEGFRVWTHSDPNELLNDYSFPASSCLIVNYNMPSMNGLEFVARLRDRRVSIPVILATGHLSENIRRRAAAVGVSAIEKPFLWKRLLDCVERAFEHPA
jgi:two-component system, LuxR family, response regulator FixJ